MANFTNINDFNKDGQTYDARDNQRDLRILPSRIRDGQTFSRVDVGSTDSGFIRLDGEKNRMVVNDGTNDRIWIGNLVT